MNDRVFRKVVVSLSENEFMVFDKYCKDNNLTKQKVLRDLITENILDDIIEKSSIIKETRGNTKVSLFKKKLFRKKK